MAPIKEKKRESQLKTSQHSMKKYLFYKLQAAAYILTQPFRYYDGFCEIKISSVKQIFKPSLRGI